MKIVGIIAEYNPFHKGHAYHLQKSMEMTSADASVAIMSGDFVQRGEPAIFDKWERARIAVDNGVDLVLELPVCYACNNAEYFAKGAVRLLNELGCVSYVSFGSEAGEIDKLLPVAKALSNETDEFKEALSSFNKQGDSYPLARYKALEMVLGEATSEVIKCPNNILAIEYLKQLILTESPITPVTVKRYGAGYHGSEKNMKIAGATVLRDMIHGDRFEEALEYVTPETAAVMKELGTERALDPESMYQLIAFSILSKEAGEIKKLFSVSEGLENRLKNAAERATNLKSLIAGTKSKRYTETRIKRMLMHLLLRLEKERFHQIENMACMYGRVLAVGERGGEIIREIKKNDDAPDIITNLNKCQDAAACAEPMLHYDLLASSIYNLARDGEVCQRSDYRMRPYVSLSCTACK